MKNHYRKVANIAVVSVGTAVGFILGVTEAVKAATFTLAPAITFKVIDLNLNGQGDIVLPGNFDVVAKGTVAETAAVAEFNLGNFSLNQNTTINSAVIQIMVHSVWVTDQILG
jgi:hypothetical protein